MWHLYASIAIGGVLLMVAPPKDVAERKSVAYDVAFIVTWPLYVLLDVLLQYMRNRRR